jgi:hypothetical protein
MRRYYSKLFLLILLVPLLTGCTLWIGDFPLLSIGEGGSPHGLVTGRWEGTATCNLEPTRILTFPISLVLIEVKGGGVTGSMWADISGCALNTTPAVVGEVHGHAIALRMNMFGSPLLLRGTVGPNDMSGETVLCDEINTWHVTRVR